MLLGKDLSQEIVAGAAFGADAARLQLGNALGAVLDGPEDVAFGFCAADADDHVLRLSLNDPARYDKCHMAT